MSDWIPGRSINGEWGYINLKTGQFSNVIPGSEEEKRQDLIKQQKAAMLTHSARQAKFDQTEGKIRNYSSERKQKKVDVPILRVNPDGTFTNIYTEQLAPYENSMRIVSPEFDLLTGLSGIKSVRKVFDVASRKKTYTGVPHRMKSDGTFMDESFLTTNDKFDIWTSDNLDFVNQYASNGGQRFSVFGKPSKLFTLPKLKTNAVVHYQDMPYTIKNGKIKTNTSAEPIDYLTWVYQKKVPIKVYRTPEFTHKNKDRLWPIPEITTDKLLQNIPLKYQGIKFQNILDGPIITNKGYADLPVNEWVYKAGADIIKAPFNTTKLDLMKKDLINIIPKGSIIVGHNVINDDK